MSAPELLLTLAALPLAVASSYLGMLALFSRRSPPLAPAARRLRFDVIVPAHDEEQGIAATVQNLLALDYPGDLFRVLVVADNCGDETAERAAAAGAQVLVRTDAEQRGKGYALTWAFVRSLAGAADAMVVIDADTLASANLLSVLAAQIEAGAQVVQADYGVRNPGASWRTRMMTIALALFHGVRSLGRERLGLSCGLRGNGMCFTRRLLQAVPHRAFSVVEDLEYGIQLGEAGYRVHYAGDAHVFGEMVATERASRSQRRRWEGGRLQLLRLHGARLLRLGLARRDRTLLDLAMDVLVPPLSVLVAIETAGLAASVGLAVHRGAVPVPLWIWAFCGAALVGYVLRGWQLSGTGARGLADLLCAPAYLAWKFTLLLRRDPARKDEWVRTARQREAP